MYINQIDELIEKIIDDLFFLLLENKNFAKILKEGDFIRSQKEINEIMINFSQKINFNQIKDLVKNNDSTNQIIETIKRYIAFYIFLTIGFFYTGEKNSYINNVVEFTKNQGSYNYKIENFFNSESNALLVKYNEMIHNILTLLNADQKKIDEIKKKPDFKDTILFLNDLGADFIEEKFKLKKLKNNENMQAHNIIKTLIIKLIYGTNDKRDFFKILESSEITEGEYMYIDIVVPIKRTMDFSVIENLIGNVPRAKHRALAVWKYFTENREKITQPPKSHEDKIIEIINSEILVPVVDDFLLYHRESEKYDRGIDPNKIKKKEDTKIKYIVGKIDKVKDLYSESIKHDDKVKNEIKKLFYVPLLNRKAVLVNIKEDISIINKFINLGRQSAENMDLFKDLEQYHIYPYINFNEFEKYGFSLSMTKTINMVRSVSFVTTGEFKQLSSNNVIQTRVGSKDMTVNIVGFMVPSTITPLQCIKIKNISNVLNLDKTNKNGLELTLQYLQKTAMNLTDTFRSIVWFFNEELDKFKLKSYEQVSRFTMQDKIKHIVAELYDRIQEELGNAISTVLSENKNLTVQEGYAIIKNFQEGVMEIALDTDIFADIEKTLYRSIIKIEPEYDTNEDKFYDSVDEDKTKKIKIKGKTSTIPVMKINLSSINEFGELERKDTVVGICQHNITMDRIDSIDKRDFLRYSNELYQFIQQYVTVNIKNDYICKSCGFKLDIEQYVEDGEYDDESRAFVSYSTPIDINLEDVLGYEKYKIAIRQIDKIIEKIATVANLLHLARSTVDIRSKRKLIIKNTIDLLLANNKKMAKTYQKRKSEISKLYGINPNYTSLWNFELENNIFIYSSRDIDKYKLLKTNNIIAYAIFFILLEINQSHVQFMGADKKKVCSFAIFDKIMDSLFGDLKIIINDKGDIANITDYKILCYMIYIISCTISSQTKMWHLQLSESQDKKKLIPIMQRHIIHTIVDVTNTVLEVGKDQPENALYGMNTTRFFKKLQDIYSDEELYQKLKKETQASTSFERKESILLHEGFIPLSGKFEPITFDIPERRLCKCSTLLMPILPVKYPKYYGISNLSNCPDGRFHEWKTKEKQLICALCKISAKDLEYDSGLSKEIKANFKDISNRNLAEEICVVDGLPHTFEITGNGEEVCTKCGNSKTHEYTSEELDKVQDVVEKAKKKREKSAKEIENEITEKAKKEQKYTEKVIKNLEEEFLKTKEDEVLHALTDEIQKVIGKELADVNLTENMYIIDHDHLGNPLSTPIKILESQKKIIEKLNHPYFKTDVLYYTSYRQRKIDVFYDAHSKVLLGYKEENKDYVLNKKHDKSIKSMYSLINKLKLLGYKSQFIDISEQYTDLMKNHEGMKVPEDLITQEIVVSVIQDRVQQLKKVIFYIKVILSRILNGHTGTIGADDYYKEKINALIDKYRKKRMNPVMSDANGNNLIFKHWKTVNNGVVPENLDNVKLKFDFEKNPTIYYNEINKIDNSGNMLTFYIVREILKFFQYNADNKVLITTISHFIVDFINMIFDIVNEEKTANNIDVKRFKYLLEFASNVSEIEEKSSVKVVEGLVTEYVEEKTKEDIEAEENQKQDIIEEREALDVDFDPDDVYEAGEEAEIPHDQLGRNFEDFGESA